MTGGDGHDPAQGDAKRLRRRAAKAERDRRYRRNVNDGVVTLLVPVKFKSFADRMIDAGHLREADTANKAAIIAAVLKALGEK